MGTSFASKDKIVSRFTALVNETVELILENGFPDHTSVRCAPP